MLFTLLIFTILSSFIYHQQKNIKELKNKYNILCDVLASEINGPEILKQLTEGSIKNELVSCNDFPLSYDELELIRKKCIKILKKINVGYGSNESEILGTFWNASHVGQFPPFTIVKTVGAKYTYLLLENNLMYFILDGKNKEFVKANISTLTLKHQILLDSTEVCKMLNDFRKKRK